MDHLKPVNDELGTPPAPGHRLGGRRGAPELRENRLRRPLRRRRVRVLLPHTTASEGRVFAERVCDRLGETTWR